jgi:hypothetical protein
MIKLSKVAIWLMFLCTILPLIILAFFNHPSVDDDFCFAYMTRDYGFWQAQKFYYDGWSGRYIGNMFSHATPLSFGSIWAVKITPILILLMLFHAFFLFLKELMDLPKSTLLLFTSVLMSIYVSQSASIVENFYWYSAVFNYPISICYWLYLVVVILRYYQPEYRKIQIAIAILAVTLCFFIVGSNEVMMLFILAFLGIIFGYTLLFNQKFSPLLILILISTILFSYFLVIKAPGSVVRMGGDAFKGNIPEALLNALKSVVQYLFSWIFLSSLLPFTILFILVCTPSIRLKNEVIFKVNRFISLLSFLILITITFFAIHYTSNQGIPDRVKNIIFALFLIGWFYHILLFKSSFKGLFSLVNIHKNSFLKSLVFALWILFFWIKTDNIKLVYEDIIKGTAYRYNQEMNHRYEQVRTSKSDTVYVTPLKNVPKSLCFDELKTNDADYFEKKVRILAPQPPKGE